MADNKISFKRGTQEVIDALTSYQAGSFYLTTDTNNFYVAQSNSLLVKLNGSILTINSADDLPSNIKDASNDSLVQPGQFVYLKENNIIAVCDSIDEDGKINWVQANVDTNIDTSVKQINVSKNVNDSTEEKLVYNITLKQERKDFTKAENNIENLDDITGKLEILADDITGIVTGTSVGLDLGELKDNALEIKTAGAGASETGFELVGGSNITLAVSGDDNKKLTLSAKDTKYSITNLGVDAENSNKLSISLKADDQESATVVSSADDVIFNKITVDGQEKTVNNQASLGSFYSAEKIDEKMRDLNALSYKGTIGLAGDATVSELPTENVNAGDAYLVSYFGDYGDFEDCNPGDLLIATGEENENGYLETVVWTRIPGTDIDTTYAFSVESNKVYSKASTAEQKEEIFELVGNSPISVATDNKQIKVSHAQSDVTVNEAGYGAVENKTLNFGETFNIPNIKVDSYGHITAANNFTMTLPQYAEMAWEELT